MHAEMLRQLQWWSDQCAASECSVRESARARRLSVRVFRDGAVEVVVPARTSPQRVVAFVAQHREWIERQRRRVRPHSPSPFPPAMLALTALDQQWSCAAVEDEGRVRLSVQGNGQLQLRGRLSDVAQARAALLGWLIDHGRAVLEAPLLALAAIMGVEVQRLQLRCQRTRWGSCSRRGTISLNCCLLFQRAPVLRYLMVHELSHLRHMNHSARFWANVARFEPDWRKLDAELLQGWRRVPSWIFDQARTP